MTTAESVAELPRHCSLGVKKSSKGHQSYWRGSKLHLDVADGQIPITALLTGTCLRDSQAAVPLMNIISHESWEKRISKPINNLIPPPTSSANAHSLP